MPKIFTNTSKEDFSFSWDSKLYTVKARKSQAFPDYLAEHAAKHFVDRELIKSRSTNIADPGSRAKIIEKCLKDVGVVAADPLEEEIALLNMKTEVKEAEETFEGLEDKKEE